MKERYFHFQDVAGTEQRLVDKVEIIQNSNGDLNFIYYLWAFGGASLLITILGMLPYFGKLAQAPPTKKRKYYLIISNLSTIFSLTGFLSLLYGDRYISFAIQKCYEAIALNALRKLMLGYLGSEEAFYRYSNEQGKQNYWRVPPCCCFIPPCFSISSRIGPFLSDESMYLLSPQISLLVQPLVCLPSIKSKMPCS